VRKTPLGSFYVAKVISDAVFGRCNSFDNLLLLLAFLDRDNFYFFSSKIGGVSIMSLF